MMCEFWEEAMTARACDLCAEKSEATLRECDACHDKALAEAVVAERGECAAIVEAALDTWRKGGVVTYQEMAAAIRARDKTTDKI